MYTDKALSTADQPAGPILCNIWVGQLSLTAFIHFVSLGVETHFRDKWFGPLLPPWTVHQRHVLAPTYGLGLEYEKDLGDLLKTVTT